MSSSFRNQRIFITQVNTYLGATLADYFLSAGAEVIGCVVDKTENSPLYDLLNIPGRIQLFFLDTKNPEVLTQALNNSLASLVVHLGEVGSLISPKDGASDLLTESVQTNLAILENLRVTGTIRGLIYLGSDKVYRKKDADGNSIEGPLREESPLGASDILSTSRLLGENLVETYRHNFFTNEKFHLHKIRLVTLRLGGVFGPGDLSEASLVHQVSRSLLFGESLTIKNPNSLRQWTFVKDQVRGISKVAQKIFAGDKMSPVYNISSPGSFSVAEIIEKLSQVSGKVAEYSTSKSPLASVSRHREQNSELALKELSWAPENTLENALLETFNWYKEYYSTQKSDTL